MENLSPKNLAEKNLSLQIASFKNNFELSKVIKPELQKSVAALPEEERLNKIKEYITVFAKTHGLGEEFLSKVSEDYRLSKSELGYESKKLKIIDVLAQKVDKEITKKYPSQQNDNTSLPSCNFRISKSTKIQIAKADSPFLKLQIAKDEITKQLLTQGLTSEDLNQPFDKQIKTRNFDMDFSQVEGNNTLLDALAKLTITICTINEKNFKGENLTPAEKQQIANGMVNGSIVETNESNDNKNLDNKDNSDSLIDSINKVIGEDKKSENESTDISADASGNIDANDELSKELSDDEINNLPPDQQIKYYELHHIPFMAPPSYDDRNN